MSEPGPPVPTDDDILVELSDFHDGTLPAPRRAEVAALRASDPRWTALDAEARATREAMSGMRKAMASPTFTADVTDAIHRRSGGAFFGRRTFGDRVPFGALMGVAAIAIAVIMALLWSSPAGSIRRPKTGGGDGPGSGDVEIVPRP